MVLQSPFPVNTNMEILDRISSWQFQLKKDGISKGLITYT